MSKGLQVGSRGYAWLALIGAAIAPMQGAAHAAEGWSKESGIRIDVGTSGAPDSSRAQDPEVVRLADGSYRMYYVGYQGLTTAILSAVSTDGVDWEKEPGIRLQLLDPETQTIEPEVLELPSGPYRYRMLVAANVRSIGRWEIRSAVSVDGLAFELEAGVRLTADRPEDLFHVHSPEVVDLGAAGLRLYYAASAASGHILSALSTDWGLSWSKEPGVRLAPANVDPALGLVYDPELRSLPTGGYRMYVSGIDVAGFERIYSATSADGIIFTADPGPVLDLGGLTDPDRSRLASPKVVSFPGQLRMYYGGRAGAVSSASTHRVLSAVLELENTPPLADAGPDQAVSAGAACEAAVQLAGTGFDADGDPLTFAWTGDALASGAEPVVILPLGEHQLTLTVDDGRGGQGSDSVQVAVFDDTSPTLAAEASPSLLWPPNHRMVEVSVQTIATDACDAAPACGIVEVSSNQPVNGPGDGNTTPDWVIVDADTVLLRAERSGKLGDRLYSIAVACRDASGNEVAGMTTVRVPKSGP